MHWVPGEVVVWRERWRDRLYFAAPVRVVEDAESGFALYLAPSTRYAFPGWAVPELPAA